VWVHFGYAPLCLCFVVVLEAAFKLPGRGSGWVCVFG
jgi:hypothetical protein